jgi:NitT/TauT family transport system substrate-binding protein
MRVSITAFAVIASLITAACGGAGTAPSASPSAPAAASPTKAPPTKVTIMVGGLSKQIYLANKLTEALGHFTDENLKVDLIDEPSGTDTETEILAGHADIGSGSYDHTIDLQAQGKTITCIAVLLQEPGEFVMVRTAKVDTVKSPKDWKGLNAGVTSIGSGTHTLMRAMTVKAGLKVSDVTFLKAGAGDTFITAMKQGTIDVGITTQPTVLRLIQQGVAKLHVDLSKPDTTREALGGDYPFISLWARGDYIKNNKDTVQRVVNAYVKTLKWIGTHKAADIADKLPADYYGGDKAAYVQALSDSMQMFSPDGKMAAGAAEFVLKTLALFNDKVKAATIDLSQTYTSEFVDKANKK